MLSQNSIMNYIVMVDNWHASLGPYKKNQNSILRMKNLKTQAQSITLKSNGDVKQEQGWDSYSDSGPEGRDSLSNFKPLGRLPSWFPKDSSVITVNRVKRANRYLSYQERRLWNLRKCGDLDQLTLRWFILLKNSKAYQLCLFNSAYKGWYWKTKEDWAMKWLEECMNRCRKWDLNLVMKRFYLIKPDNQMYDSSHRERLIKGLIKIRPIGAPIIDSKMISKSFNNLIYLIKWDSFEDFQHGFRPGRGIHTVTFKLYKEIIDNKKLDIYEFDLKGFFNQVRIKWIYSILTRSSRLLAENVYKIVQNLYYKLDGGMFAIEDTDTELRIIGKKRTKRGVVPLISRSGLPQGLSISPILCTLLLDVVKPPKDLFMMADDGIFLGLMSDLDFRIWSLRLAELGIPQVPEKSRQVLDGKFKFVGIVWNLKEKTLTCKKTSKTWNWADWDRQLELVNSMSTEQNKLSLIKEIIELRDRNLKSWLLTVNQNYGERDDKSWNWDMNPSSMGSKYRVENLGIEKEISILKNSIYYQRVRYGCRWFSGSDAFHNISALSSICNSEILTKIKGLALSPLSPGSTFFDCHVLLEKKETDKRFYFETLDGNTLTESTRPDTLYAKCNREYLGDYFYASLERTLKVRHWTAEKNIQWRL